MTTATEAEARTCSVCSEPISPIRVEMNSRVKTCSKACSAVHEQRLRRNWNRRDRVRKAAERALNKKKPMGPPDTPVGAARRARGIPTDRHGRVVAARR